MKYIISLFILCFIALPVQAKETPRIATELDAQRYAPCAHKDDRERARCEAVQRRRARYHTRFKQMRTGAGGHLLGHGVIRQAERAARQKRNEQLLKQRRTYSQFEPTDDVNTQRRGYINQFRQDRLACMYERHGRTRALCLERVENNIRAEMRAQRGKISNWKE